MEEFILPEGELEFEFMRSSGAGGQNVNKVETKVRVVWDFENSGSLSEEEKVLVREKMQGRMTGEGEIFVVVEETRSQARNREIGVERLQELVSGALEVEDERVVKVPRRVKRKIGKEREEFKKRRGEVKKTRKDVEW